MSLTLQTTILELYNETKMIIIILCHILLIFKYHIKGKTHTEYRYSNSQLNERKQMGEANKPRYQQ